MEIRSLNDASVWRLDTFLAPPGTLRDRAVSLEGPERHHAFDVARVRTGDVVRLIDGEGTEALARVDAVGRARAALTILDARVHSREDGVALTIVQALPRSRAMDEVVRRCAELGVAEVVPVTSDRAPAGGRRPDAERLERWRAVALSAAKQSRGVFVTRVAPVVPLAATLGRVGEADLALVAWEEETEATLSDVLSVAPRPRRMVAVVGPEGGLGPREVEALTGAGATAVGLGRRILRADWAAAALASVVASRFGGLLP